MSDEVYNLTNINFLTKDQYDEIESPSDEELYCIEGDFVVEYVQATSYWYQVWASGIIEQGGVKADGDTEIEFAKEMAGVNYSISLTPVESVDSVIYVSDLATTGFTVSDDVEMRYYVKG